MVALTLGQGEPADVRLRQITGTGFEALVAVPVGQGGNYSALSVPYLAAKAGVHTLPDGRRFEAGRVDTAKLQKGTVCVGAPAAAWEPVTFSAAFSSAPAFVAKVQTAHNEAGAVPMHYSTPWLTVAVTSLTSADVSVALEMAETSKVGDIAQPETVGYVAMEPGQGSFASGAGQVSYSALLTGLEIKGFDDGFTEVSLQADLGSMPLVVGGQASRKGNNGGWLRMAARSSTTATLFIDEDTYCDSERKHVSEQVGLLAWSGPLSIPPPAPTTTTTTLAPAGVVTLEVREVTVSNQWVNVAFTLPFAEVPVVVMSPTTSSTGSQDPAAIRIKDISVDGFSAIIAKPPNTPTTQETMTVTFLAVLPGARQLPGRGSK